MQCTAGERQIDRPSEKVVKKSLRQLKINKNASLLGIELFPLLQPY
jgi:hypothetical protein